MFDRVSLAGLTEVLAAAAAADVDALCEDDLLATATELERLQRFVDGARCRVLAKLERDGTTDVRFGLPTARWLAREAELPKGVASGRVHLAKRLQSTLPVTGEALARGEINVHHAQVLSRAANPRIVEAVREIEAELLVLRKGCATFDAWKADVGHIARQLDADGGFTPDDDPSRARFRGSRGLDDGFHFSGSVYGADAASFEAALNEGADALWRRLSRDAALSNALPSPTRPMVMAMALLELVRYGHQARKGGTASEPAADITVVMNLMDPFRSGRTSYGARLSEELMEFLACNATFAALIANDLGVPLDLGRSSRFASREQRRALLYRHGGTCAFPGCDVPLHRCDIHHIRAWDDGGRTDLVNLIPLCRYHHGVNHRRGWELVTNRDHTYTWTTPLGEQLHSRPPPGRLAA